MQRGKQNIKSEDLPFFFIVGRPRSGTTLLRTLFDAHPNVAIPLECKFALDLYPRYGKITHWSQKDIDGFFKDLWDQLLFDTWTIDLEKLKADLDNRIGESQYSNICRTVYLQYQSFYDKEDIRMIGDKNPGYTIYTRKLAKIFPGSKFIHIVRDHRDNFLSLKNVHFELPIPSMVATKWRLFYKRFKRDSRNDPGNYLILRYEDLVAEPEKRMQELCKFLGLDYREEIFHFDDKKDDVLNAYPPGFVERYHSNLLNKVNASRVGLWRDELNEKEIALLDYAAGKTAEVAGYERKYLTYGPGLALLAQPGIFLAYILAFMTKIVDYFPYRMRINILNKWPLAIATWFQRKKERKAKK